MMRVKELIQTVVAVHDATTEDIFKILDVDPYDLPGDTQDRLRKWGINFRVAFGKDYTNRDIRYVGASRAPVSETSSAPIEEAPLIDYDAPLMEVGEVVTSTTSP